MENIKSILEFKQYIVNEITFKNNLNFKSASDNISVDLDITPKIKINGNEMIISLVTSIFKESEKNNYPFEMLIDISGYFYTKDDNPQRFQANAIAILYPYVRAIVSTYTASANIPPLILPAINVNAMLESNK